MRAFVAVVPPAAAVAPLRALVDAVRRTDDGLGWVTPERWHFTLAFLGDITDKQAARLTPALDRVAARHAPFSVNVDGAGWFPRPTRPQVLWAGLAGDVAALTAVAGDVVAAARGAHVPVDGKAFRPHLTLARVRRSSQVDGLALLGALARVEGPPFTAEELVLLRSHLGPQPRYEPLQRWRLAHQA